MLWAVVLFPSSCDYTVSFNRDGAADAATDVPNDGARPRDAGVPTDGCPCHTLFEPVCSYEGVTYENMCFAECAGADVECERACPCEVGQPCRGLVPEPCPAGFECLDDLSDDCFPDGGGSDCGGLCAPEDCGDGGPQSIPCPEGYTCVGGQCEPA